MANHMLRQDLDQSMKENEDNEQKIKDLELEVKYGAFERQGLVDGEMLAD